jgi:hypothetical protein
MFRKLIPLIDTQCVLACGGVAVWLLVLTGWNRQSSSASDESGDSVRIV